MLKRVQKDSPEKLVLGLDYLSIGDDIILVLSLSIGLHQRYYGYEWSVNTLLCTAMTV